MKKIPLLFTILFLFVITTKAQTFEQKLEANNIGTNGIFFFDDNNGWITGWGFINKTTDGGISWKKTALSSEDISAGEVQFVSEQKGFATAGKNLFLTSEDGGISWTETELAEVNGRIKDLKFINEARGYLSTSTGQVIVTEDSGATWTAIQVIPDSIKKKSLNSIDAMGNGVAVVGNFADYLYYSKDGGKTWAKGTLEGKLGNYQYTRSTLWSVKFITENNIHATGWGSTIFMQPTIHLLSTDGGETWQYQDQLENNTYANSQDVCFKDDQNGLAVSGSISGGIIVLNTTDGGKNWIPNYLPYGGSLDKVTNVGDKVWALGFGGLLLYSPDFGATWENLNDRPDMNFYSMSTFGENGIFAAGYGGYFVKSNDGGENWMYGYAGTPGHINRVAGTHFLSENLGYVVGSGRTCFKTTDGGVTWESIMKDTLSFKHGNEGVYFLDENNGFVVGSSNNKDVIYSTNDGGENWTVKENVYGNSLTCITFGDEKNGIIGGKKNLLLYTRDAGVTWDTTENNGGETSTINSVFMLDSNNAIAVAGKYLLLTQDGGKNWSKLDKEGNNWKKAIMLSETEWLVLGRSSALKTMDSGTTWTEIELPGNGYSTMIVDKTGFLWVAAFGTTILKSQNTVGIEKLDVTPNIFALEQNYPNPFNPSTTIRYSITENAHVKMTLFDVIGREVDVLINKYQTAGSYNLSYTAASNLSSGIYFYTLTVGNKTITKKLMLLK